MKLKCPNCQLSLKIPDRMAGRRAKCPNCQHSWMLPELKSESTGDSLPETSVPSPPLDLSLQPVGKRRTNEGTTTGITHSENQRSITQPIQQPAIPVTESQPHPLPWKERLEAAITWLIKQTIRLSMLVKDDAKNEFVFFRLHNTEFWKQVLSGPIRLRWGDDALPSSREMFIPVSEKNKSGWRVSLPSRCVKCGAKTNEPEQNEQPSLVNFYACQLVWVALAIALILLVWQPTILFIHFSIFKTLLLVFAAIIAIFRLRRQETAQLSFRRCNDHAAMIKFPRLFIVAGGLIVRLGSEKARQWLAGSRQDDDDVPAVPVGKKSDRSIPRPAIDSDDALPLPAIQAPLPSRPMTIAMVDDSESTPIVHSENSLGQSLSGQIPFSTDLPFDSNETSNSEKLPALPKLSSLEASAAQSGLSTINLNADLDDEILEGIPVDDDPSYASTDEFGQPPTPPETIENPFHKRHPNWGKR